MADLRRRIGAFDLILGVDRLDYTKGLLERLEAFGDALRTDEAELARLRSPIGLDLGARTPEETAVSIAAELIQLRWGGTGHPLTSTEGRIHHQFAG